MIRIGFFYGGQVGSGLIQVLHCRIAGYQPGGLMNGRFAASFNTVTQADTAEFVKQVFKIVKKHFKKIYRIDPATKETQPKPETRFFAGPDAIAQYDQVDGLYLTNHNFAYFTTKI